MDLIENAIKNTSKEIEQQMKTVDDFNKTLFNVINSTNTELIEGISKNIDNFNVDMLKNLDDFVQLIGLNNAQLSNDKYNTRKRKNSGQVNPYNE